METGAETQQAADNPQAQGRGVVSRSRGVLSLKRSVRMKFAAPLTIKSLKQSVASGGHSPRFKRRQTASPSNSKRAPIEKSNRHVKVSNKRLNSRHPPTRSKARPFKMTLSTSSLCAPNAQLSLTNHPLRLSTPPGQTSSKGRSKLAGINVLPGAPRRTRESAPNVCASV